MSAIEKMVINSEGEEPKGLPNKRASAAKRVIGKSERIRLPNSVRLQATYKSRAACIAPFWPEALRR